MKLKMNCKICDSPNSRRQCVKDAVSYSKCCGCGFVFQEQLPTAENFARIYDNESHYFVDDKKGVDYVQNEQSLQRNAKFYIEVISREVPDFKTYSKDVLDIGCGTGVFLSEIAKLGHRCRGLEISRWASEFGRERYGIDILCRDLNNADLPENAFDVITLMHVIEHLPEPGNVLSQIYRLLRPGGVLILATPDVDCLTAKFTGTHWRYYLPNEHIHLFNQRSLEILAGEHGFKPFKYKQALYEEVPAWLANLDLIQQIVKSAVKKWIGKKAPARIATQRDGLILFARKS